MGYYMVLAESSATEQRLLLGEIQSHSPESAAVEWASDFVNKDFLDAVAEEPKEGRELVEFAVEQMELEGKAENYDLSVVELATDEDGDVWEVTLEEMIFAGINND